jgi:hypothetical protein
MTQFTDASIRAKSSARTKVSASLTCTRTCGLAMPIGMLENLRRRACGASAGLVAASAGLVAAQAAARVSADLNMAGEPQGREAMQRPGRIAESRSVVSRVAS